MFTYITKKFRALKSWITRSRKNTLISIVAVALLAFLVFNLGGNTPEEMSEEVTSTVEVAIAGTLGNGSSSVFSGTVTSANRAEIRAQKQGQVIAINAKRGSHVGRGAVIAAIENSSERAALSQAEAQLQIAEANLAKARSSAEISDISLADAERDYAQTRITSLQSVEKAYISADNVFSYYVRPLFENPFGVSPYFIYSSEAGAPNAEWYVEQNYESVEAELRELQKVIQSQENTPSPDTDVAIAEATATLASFDTFMANLTTLANSLRTSPELTASEITTIRNNISTARTSINTAHSTVESAESSLEGARVTYEQARIRNTSSQQGEVNEDVRIAEAGRSQAASNVEAARVTYQKTLIVSPLSGRITTLDLELGEVVSPLQHVATVVNEGTLEVSVYVNTSDAELLQIGQSATVGQEYTGIINDISPALDAQTQKQEVVIALQGAGTELLQGQIVSVSFDAITKDTSAVTTIHVPLTAVKVTPSSTFVLGVDESNTLYEIPVTMGLLSGNTVQITSGLDASDLIVTDARGHNAGETITPTQK